MLAVFVILALTLALLYPVAFPSLPPNVIDCAVTDCTTDLPEQTYDYIVVGGGTAGNVVASLLSDDPDLDILLIEAGPFTKTSRFSLPSIPGLTSLNVASNSLDHNLNLEPQKTKLSTDSPPGFKNRSIPIPRGKVLGGSNELNFMLHVPAHSGDYDHWAAQTSSSQWSSNTMKRHESSVFDAISPTPKTPATSHPLTNAFVSSHPNAFHYTAAVQNGVRSSTARAYTIPRLLSPRRNLHVHVNAPVSILLHTADRVTAVEYLGTVAHARHEVIVCAGAYHSPALLVKSGIGNEHVGRHLQDHPIVGLKYRLGPEEGVWWPSTLTLMTVFGNPWNLFDYFWNGSGPLSTSGVDFGLFASTNRTYEDRNMPDLQIHGMPTAADGDFMKNFLKFEPTFQDSFGVAADYSTLFAQGLIIAPTLLHTNSRGTVTVGSDGEPVVTLESFEDEDDLRRLVKGIRLVQQLMATPEMQVHEPMLLTHAGLERELGVDTDAYWREYLKLFGFFVYHPVGSCRMGFDPSDSVVDPSLRVHGMAGVRVCDASIMPENTSGNTNVPTAAIAHNCVEMIRGIGDN